MASNNSITRFVRLPDLISLGNGVLGILSIICSIHHYTDLAVLAIVLAGVLDFLDGRIARRMGLASPFGVQLDSLCDICSFIVAPAIFAYTMDSIDVTIRIALVIIYLIAGLLRLARFNITGTLDNGKYFEGMPVPFSIAIVCSYFLFTYFGLPLLIWMALYFIHAFLMVSTLKIRKL
ncbi:CDP-alcohol phosphatidyltransferase family protein [Desertivirga arenae]|uniref:CDP-alcohol phosphatidyltransferase family protein n=1 Tax=Desertivirga arenae TaxID=2810309 RepID=UPI001A973A9F|nr:CDP-alcohol phosphatidyltransferase family protein [Pedobacter sp. SYSU D00823]